MKVLFRAEVDLESFMAGGYIGSLLDINGKRYAVGALTYNGRIEDLHGTYPIKNDTLSINFSNMIDSEGNKIFASLSEDGKGGDIVELEHIRYLEDDEPSYMIKGLCIFMNSSFFVEDIDNNV